MPRELTPEEQERRADEFDASFINGIQFRRNRRLPEMIDAVRQRWAGEAEFEVVAPKRAKLRRVA